MSAPEMGIIFTNHIDRWRWLFVTDNVFSEWIIFTQWCFYLYSMFNHDGIYQYRSIFIRTHFIITISWRIWSATTARVDLINKLQQWPTEIQNFLIKIHNNQSFKEFQQYSLFFIGDFDWIFERWKCSLKMSIELSNIEFSIHLGIFRVQRALEKLMGIFFFFCHISMFHLVTLSCIQMRFSIQLNCKTNCTNRFKIKNYLIMQILKAPDTVHAKP